MGGRVWIGVKFLNSLPCYSRTNRCLLVVPPVLDIQLKVSSSYQHHDIISGEREYIHKCLNSYIR